MRLRVLDVPVDGGELRVLQWGTGRRVALAVHGITASAMSWQAVARQMPPGWTLAAPDLRGRGHSAHLPGPYGLERHAADVAAVLRHFGWKPPWLRRWPGCGRPSPTSRRTWTIGGRTRRWPITGPPTSRRTVATT